MALDVAQELLKHGTDRLLSANGDTAAIGVATVMIQSLIKRENGLERGKQNFWEVVKCNSRRRRIEYNIYTISYFIYIL